MINDEAIWLIERPREQAAIDLFRDIPPRWEDRTEADWLAYANAVKRKVHDGRFEFPREWPYYLGWNAQHSNAPGTTCFLPVVDHTRQYINGLLILLSEPHGKVPLFLDEWRPFRPRGAVEWVAWLASKVGLVDPIPYQPIGGLARARGGFATPDAPLPLGAVFADARTDARAVLPAAEPDADGRGAAARRLGPRHAADPGHLAPRAGTARARLPRAPGQAGARTLAPLAAGAGLAAELRRHRRRARRALPAVRDRHGRGGRPGDRGEAERAVRLPEVFGRPTATARAPRLPHAAPPARGDRLHEGDLPLPGRDLRPLPGAHRRLPPAGHLGAVLAPGGRVLRALRRARLRPPRRRGQGDLGRR